MTFFTPAPEETAFSSTFSEDGAFIGKNTKVLYVLCVDVSNLLNSIVVDKGPLKVSKITFLVAGSLTLLERMTGISTL